MKKSLINLVKFFSLILIFLYSFFSILNDSYELNSINDSRKKVFVVDTGLSISKRIKPYLCKSGHRSFIPGVSPFIDNHGHGTNIIGLISKGINPKKHCIVVLKFWSKSRHLHLESLVVKALKYAYLQKADYINLSLGGPKPYQKEYFILKRLLQRGTKIAVAAGNNHDDLDESCNYYPACYAFKTDNFRVVGSNSSGIDRFGHLFRYSNYGVVVTHFEDGSGKGSPLMTGTSQATAINMAKWIMGSYK